MPSTTAMVNRALALIGARRIVSLEGTDATSQLIRDTLGDVRQGLLQSHPWPFATFPHELAREAAPMDVGPAYSYRKPQANNQHGGLMRTLGVFSDADLTMPAFGYVDAGPTLYADHPALWLLGLFDIQDPNQMSPLFREALSFKLASEYALPLSNSRAMHDDYAAEAESKLLRARAIADMEGPPVAVPPSTWEIARFGGSVGAPAVKFETG